MKKLVTLTEAIKSGCAFDDEHGNRFRVINGVVKVVREGGTVCMTSFTSAESLTQPVWEIIREPRTWWTNIYKDGPREFYQTEDYANRLARSDRLECIQVREVLEGEE